MLLVNPPPSVAMVSDRPTQLGICSMTCSMEMGMYVILTSVAQEVAATIPGLLGGGADQPEIRFMNQGGGLKRFGPALPGPISARPACAAHRRPWATVAKQLADRPAHG